MQTITKAQLKAIGDYIRGQLPEWLEEELAALVSAGARQIPVELLERMARLEEELKQQGVLIKSMIEQMNARFEELRQHSEAQFKQLLHYSDKRFEELGRRIDENRQHSDSRFEDMNRRFEDMRQHSDKRFEDMRSENRRSDNTLKIMIAALTLVILVLGVLERFGL